MYTTTVRFTTDQWAIIAREADRMGIGRATFVREAVVFYLGFQTAESRISSLEDRFAGLVERVQQMAGTVTMLTVRMRGIRGAR